MVNGVKCAALASVLIGLCAGAAEARPPTAEDVLTLHELGDYRGGLALSPDGTQVAMFERELRLSENDYTYRLLVMPSTGGAPRLVADGGDIILFDTAYGSSGSPIDRAPTWSPDGQRLAYLYKHDNRVELWSVRPAGGSATAVLTGPGDVLRYAWLDATHLVVETGTPRDALHAMNDRELTLGFAVDDALEPYYSLRPIPPVLSQKAEHVVDVVTGGERSASEAEALHLNVSPAAPAPADAISTDKSAGRAVWIAPRTTGDRAESPLLALSRQDAHGAVQRCDAPSCAGHLTHAWLFGDEVVFEKLEGHGNALTALYAWRAGAVTLLRREDEMLVGCGRAGGSLICYQESPLQPRRLVSINPATGELQVLYDPNPHWREMDLTHVERIDVKDAYGNDSYAHLVYPRGYIAGRRYPVVIVQYISHGFLRGGTGGEYPIHPLAARGYFVLSVNRPDWDELATHLTADELEVRTELDNSENQMKQTALEAMLALLDARGLSDTQRIGITGLSDGAETVYWGITRSHLFAAAVTSNPPTDVTSWTLGAGAFRAAMTREGAGGPWSDPSSPWGQWWQRNVTAPHADAIHTPLLMNLPDAEALQGFALATRLQELQRPVDVYIYPGAYHVKWRPRQRLAAQERAMDWLDFWLRGVEREDPDEPGRLARWRNLRSEITPPGAASRPAH